MKETVVKKIIISEHEWEDQLGRVLAYDHPGTDYLFVQTYTDNPLERAYRAYRVGEPHRLVYAGEEFPEAIFACGF